MSDVRQTEQVAPSQRTETRAKDFGEQFEKKADAFGGIAWFVWPILFAVVYRNAV